MPVGNVDLSAFIAPAHLKVAKPPFAPADHDQILAQFRTLGMAEGDKMVEGFVSREIAMNQAFLTLGERAGNHFARGLLGAIHAAAPKAWQDASQVGRAIDRGVAHGIGTTHNHVTITINGTGQNARQIAEMVKDEFIKMDKRSGGHLQPGARSPRTRGT